MHCWWVEVPHTQFIFNSTHTTLTAAPSAAKRPRTSEEDETKRQARLESNRKAARESRRRKKVLVEELQRSVIFFTRANAQLKQKNDGLEGMLFAARSQIKGGEGGAPSSSASGLGTSSNNDAPHDKKPAAVDTSVNASASTTLPAPSGVQLQLHQPAPVATQQAPAPVQQAPTPAANATMLQQQQAPHQAAMANNMANWLAMGAGMVPNPMAAAAMAQAMSNPTTAAGVQAAMNSMFNPMSMAASNPAAFMGMAAMGNPFLAGQLQHQQMAAHAQHQQQQQAAHLAAATVPVAAPVAAPVDASGISVAPVAAAASVNGNAPTIEL